MTSSLLNIGWYQIDHTILLFFPYRYKATIEPIQYWNENVGQNPWKKTFWYYFLPLSCFSVVFNLPKFWEVHLVSVSYEDMSKVIIK